MNEQVDILNNKNLIIQEEKQTQDPLTRWAKEETSSQAQWCNVLQYNVCYQLLPNVLN